MLIAHSIVHGNDTQIVGGCDVAESVVQGGRGGSANINADPQFVDAAGGNFRIGAASPAKDLSVLSVAPVDSDGAVRDAFPDAGAYEAP
jgi:hypothetical protein